MSEWPPTGLLWGLEMWLRCKFVFVYLARTLTQDARRVEMVKWRGGRYSISGLSSDSLPTQVYNPFQSTIQLTFHSIVHWSEGKDYCDATTYADFIGKVCNVFTLKYEVFLPYMLIRAFIILASSPSASPISAPIYINLSRSHITSHHFFTIYIYRPKRKLFLNGCRLLVSIYPGTY